MLKALCSFLADLLQWLVAPPPNYVGYVQMAESGHHVPIINSEIDTGYLDALETPHLKIVAADHCVYCLAAARHVWSDATLDLCIDCGPVRDAARRILKRRRAA